MVERKHQHVEVHLPGKRQLEIAGTVPKTAALKRPVPITSLNLLRNVELLEILESRLIDPIEHNIERARFEAAVEECQEHRLGLQ